MGSAPANSPQTGPSGRIGLYRRADGAQSPPGGSNGPGESLWRISARNRSGQPNRNRNQSPLRQRVVKVLPISAVPMVMAGSEGDGQVGVR